MKRFMTTTAIILAMAGSANAQTEQTTATETAAAAGFTAVEVQPTDFYASDLIGMRIYNSEAEVAADAKIADGGEAEWDDIGEINDVVVTQDGQVSAVILGVGGFLGAGERDVAVPMSAIHVVHEEGDSGDRFLVVNTSKEALEAMPVFERELDGKAETKADADMKANAGMGAAGTEPAPEAAPAGEAAPGMGMVSDPAPDRAMLNRPSVTREGYTEVDMATATQLTVENLEGATVYGANDETVGDIDTLVVGDDGKIQQVVVNVGGFLGMGAKSVAVTFDELQILTNEAGDEYRIYIDSTKEALKAQPEYEVK
jgi:hypothetical protein